MKVMGPKDPEEVKTLSFDFSPEVATSDAIVAATVTVSVENGTDADPATMVASAATFTGKVVYQRVVGGLNGVIYKLRCRATDSSGGVHVIVGKLEVARL